MLYRIDQQLKFGIINVCIAVKKLYSKWSLCKLQSICNCVAPVRYADWCVHDTANIKRENDQPKKKKRPTTTTTLHQKGAQSWANTFQTETTKTTYYCYPRIEFLKITSFLLTGLIDALCCLLVMSTNKLIESFHSRCMTVGVGGNSQFC